MQTKTLFAPLFAAFAACQPTPAATDDPGIRALFDAHEQAWNSHDPGALAALYATNATVVTPHGRRVTGQAALLEMFTEPGPTKQTTTVMTLDGVQWLADDLAIVDGNQTLSGPGTRVTGNHAKLVAVVMRDEGTWKFLAARPFIPSPIQG